MSRKVREYISLKVIIESPKNKTGDRKGKDLSDHFPLVVDGLGLRIISYNLQFLPKIITTAEGKRNTSEITQSVHAITSYFAEKNADICCVQELYDNTANALIEAEMVRMGYVATARVGEQEWAFINGGARVFIKSELAGQKLSSYEYVYKNKIDYFFGSDAISNKGIIHTCFYNSDATKTHVFNSHLQSFYTGREHYAEVALAQCVEFKRFVEAQKAKGLIRSTDKIILCGDFNIPKPNSDEETVFLFEKMQRLLGPQFIIQDYTRVPDGPTHTLSRENSYNAQLPPSSDMDTNVDMVMVFDPETTTQESLIDAQLADIYCDIQLAISHYVTKNATIFSHWLLSDAKTYELKKFNERVRFLIQNADQIKSKNESPLDNPEWCAQALDLLSGPQKSTLQQNVQSEMDFHAMDWVSDEGEALTDMSQCKEKFDKLMYALKQLHAEMHRNYMDDPSHYRNAFAVSLKLNHVLLHAGNKFFKAPTAYSFKKFQGLCLSQLTIASTEFEKHSSYWAKLSPIFKGFLGLLAIISILPGIAIAAHSSYGILRTFFASQPTDILTHIKTEFGQEGVLHNPGVQ